MGKEDLHIPVARITDAGFSVDATVQGDEIRPEGLEPLTAGAIDVRGRLFDVDAEYVFRGRVEGRHALTCDRCLTKVEAPFDLEATWVFERKGEVRAADMTNGDEDESVPADQGAMIFTGDVIELEPAVWEEIVLAIPFKVLCDDACKGLCSGCGANLNDMECSCDPVEVKKRQGGGLAALAEMFPDLNPNASSEENDRAGT